MESTGCIKCDEVRKETGDNTALCLGHQIELAEWEVMAAMNTVEKLKQKKKEAQDVTTRCD